MRQRTAWLLGIALVVFLGSNSSAQTTMSFSGIVTSMDEDVGFFEVPEPIAVGSVVTGALNYSSVADDFYDPSTQDCQYGYIFRNGTMVVLIEGTVWEYRSLAILVNDCASNDLIECLGQTAVTYPPAAPAQRLTLKLFDLSSPFALVDGLDLPLTDEDIDFDQATRMIGRVGHDNWGEIRFDVTSISIGGTVAVEPGSWGSVKALYLD